MTSAIVASGGAAGGGAGGGSEVDVDDGEELVLDGLVELVVEVLPLPPNDPGGYT
ncbi:hypothetical protein [Mycobacterium sp. NPDC006124]|uniref:hypothetical protein n=1 Tax=Mycobacterium sp. NPDC006124 TaxID=3156729 RepID=UPI0033AFB283